MEFLFWQSSDPTVYLPMLDITSAHNAKYCAKERINFEKFIGIYRGYYNWQSIFNRISRLKMALDQGFRGWFLYLDADAYVYDTTFDIKGYLQAHQHKLLIAGTGGDNRRLAVNDGVFFANLSHSDAPYFVNEWDRLFREQASDEYLKNHTQWSADSVNDQDLLHAVFGADENLFDPIVVVDDGSLINYKGRFIRQVLRTSVGGFEERVRAIAEDLEVSRRSFPLD